MTDKTSDDALTDQTALADEAIGLCFVDPPGNLWIDSCAGRVSPKGYGLSSFRTAIQGVAGDLVSPAPRVTGSSGEPKSIERFRQCLAQGRLSDLESIRFAPTRDLAMESLVMSARKRGAPNRYRTVAVSGFEHGGTALCRSLSGIPDLQQDLGPLVAGFNHVENGNEASLARIINDQTCAVVVSPLATQDRGHLVEQKFLKRLREACNDVGALLIADESNVPFGFYGAPVATSAIAGIDLDAAIFSAGLLGDLGGAVFVGPSELSSFEPSNLDGLFDAVLASCLDEIGADDWFQQATQEHREFAVLLAKQLREFEFVRDVTASGACISIELDVPSAQWIEAASQSYLRLVSAGEYAVLLQLPLIVSTEDRERLLERMIDSLRAVQRLTSVASV